MTAYLHHAINGLCKAGNFVVQNYAPINAAYESTQSAALYEGSRDVKFFDTLYKVNYLFCITELSSLFVGTYHFLKEVDQKYHLFHYLSSYHPEVQSFIITAGIAGFFLTAKEVVRAINRIMKKWSDPSLETTSEREEGSKKETLKAELNKPLNEKIRQHLFVSKIIINLSLLFFGPANPLLAISMVAELASLGIITTRKWINISKEIDYGENPLKNTLSRVKASFYLLMRPPLNSQNHLEETECSICYDKPNTIDTYYCMNHTFHSRCIVDYAKRKINALTNEMRNIQRTVYTTWLPLLIPVKPISFLSFIILKEASYTVSIPKNALPSCPNCREQPTFYSFQLELTDAAYGNTEARVKWV